MKQSLLILLLFVLGIANASAQNKTITGKVTGADDGQSIPGVSVKIEGRGTGTQTDIDGHYSLSVPVGTKSLTFSYVGFAPQTVQIGTKTVVNINLVLDTKVLSEVIVVPFGTAKKETFTGSAAVVSAKDIADRPVTNVLNALAGAAPGITLSSANGQPGSSPAIRIRGIGSINAASSPLIVVDGVQYENGLSNLNSDDVESMSILKDAASTALYGAKAANGVIIITTKHGKKNSNQINVKVTEGYTSRAIPEYSTVNPFQYYPLVWQAIRNSLAYPAAGNGLAISDANMLASGLGTRNANNLQVFNGKTYLDVSQTLGALTAGGVYKASNDPFNVPANQIVDVNGNINPNAQLRYDDLDWFKPLMQSSLRSNYGLNFSGGAEKSDYFVSIDYTKEKGYIIKSDFERVTARVNVNSTPVNWFKTGFNVTGTLSTSNLAQDGSSTSFVNPFFFARNVGPVYNIYAHDPTTGAPLYDATGNPLYDTGGLSGAGLAPNRPSGAFGGRHVLEETLLNDNLFKRNVLSARTYGEISFLKYFKYTTNLSGDLSNNYASSFGNPVVGDSAPSGAETKTNTLATTFNLQELLNYAETFGKHHVSALAGHENYARVVDLLTGSRSGIVAAGLTDFANFTTTQNLGSSNDNDKSEGYFSQVNYDYNEKYLLSGSVRLDKSSRFASAVRDGYFGSVGAGWRIDKENFLQNVSWIDLLKLRASYGTTGNYQTLDAAGGASLYPSLALYNFNNNAFESGIIANPVIGNPDIRWEVNKTIDAALEFALFKNRLSGSIEYFDRQSSNLLFSVPLPVSSGFSSQFQNIGTMYNKGFEINLAGDLVRLKNFVWNMNVNFTTFKNQITRMPDKTPEIVSGTKKLSVGHSIFDFYLPGCRSRRWIFALYTC
jgi:TonB-linked SusC/RagA family outer membrane protein